MILGTAEKRRTPGKKGRKSGTPTDGIQFIHLLIDPFFLSFGKMSLNPYYTEGTVRMRKKGLPAFLGTEGRNTICLAPDEANNCPSYSSFRPVQVARQQAESNIH